jgi:hypothetical protein
LRLAPALFLAAVVLAGCGGPTRTAAERFADSGNKICRDTKKKSLDLQAQQPKGWRAKLSAVGREGQAGLKALVPPPELQAARDTFFADLAELERVGANLGERPKAIALSNRLPVEARALGWTDCAA